MVPVSNRSRLRTLTRWLRHPYRSLDNQLWLHYAPDVAPLIQQSLDKDGTITIPAGHWKIGHTLNVPEDGALTAQDVHLQGTADPLIYVHMPEARDVAPD